MENEEQRKASIEELNQKFDVKKETAGQYKKRLISAKWKFIGQFSKVQQLKSNPPNMITDPLDYLAYRETLKTAQDLLIKYEDTYTQVKMTKGRLLRPVVKLENELKDREQNKTEFIIFVDKVKAWFFTNGNQIFSSITIILFFVFFGPLIWKFIWYYIVAPISKYFSPINLIGLHNDGQIKYGKSDKIFSVKIEPKSSLIVKMNWVQRYNECGKKKTKAIS